MGHAWIRSEMTFASEARNAEVISDHILGSSRWRHPEPAARRLFSPKGWDKSAQGNALVAEERQRSQALKGRDKRFRGAHGCLRPFRAGAP